MLFQLRSTGRAGGHCRCGHAAAVVSGSCQLEIARAQPQTRVNKLSDFIMSPVTPQGALLGISEVFTPAVAAVAVSLSGGCDPEVAKNADRIYEELEREESRFRVTLAAGRKVLGDILQVGDSTCRSSGNFRKRLRLQHRWSGVDALPRHAGRGRQALE